MLRIVEECKMLCRGVDKAWALESSIITITSAVELEIRLIHKHVNCYYVMT